MGPVAYLLNASDLRPIDQNNKIFKYADDTFVIVCDSNTHTIPKELQHISEWATRHNLKLNQAKSKEIVVSPGFCCNLLHWNRVSDSSRHYIQFQAPL